MLTVNSTINLAGQAVPNIIPAVQGDTGRVIVFTLADFTIPAGSTATYYVQKPSGEAVYNSATIDNNKVTVELTAQSLAETGDNYGQVRILNGEDVVTSFDFILLVKPFRGIGAIESTTEMNIFDEAVQNAMEQFDSMLPDIIAPEFDSSTEYAAGDYVIYGGKLYQFTSAHSGAWTGTDAEVCTAAEKLEAAEADTAALKEDLLDTIGFYNKNIFTAALKYSGKTIFTKNCTVTLDGNDFSLIPTAANPQFGGTQAAGAGFNFNLPYGYLIPCGGISELYFIINNDVFNRNYVTFYDNVYVSLGFTDYISSNEFAVPVQEGAAYAVLRCGSNKTTVGITYSFNVKCYDNASYNEAVSKQISSINDTIDTFKQVPYQLNGGYISNTGNVMSPGAETKEVYTNEIPFNYRDTLKVVISLPEIKSMWGVYVLYDENHNFLSRVNMISVTEGDYFERIITNTVNNARYVVISYRSYGISTTVIYSNDTLKIIHEEIPKTNLVHFINPIVKGINHRGYVSAPENTLPAFRLSRKKGFQYVETDVEFTSDGIPVLLHDATINRTARNADGTALSQTVNIHDITYEQVLTYDFGIYKGEEYAGTKIPTLEEFFALCRSLGLLPYVELKSGTEYTQAQVESVVDIAKKYGMADKVSWISFSDVYLGYVKTYDTKARLGFVCESPGDNQIAQILALRSGENEVFADCHYSSINSTGAGKCIRNGIPLEAWTLNSKADLATINPYVTGVTTDNLDIAQTLYWQGMQS